MTNSMGPPPPKNPNPPPQQTLTPSSPPPPPIPEPPPPPSDSTTNSSQPPQPTPSDSTTSSSEPPPPSDSTNNSSLPEPPPLSHSDLPPPPSRSDLPPPPPLSRANLPPPSKSTDTQTPKPSQGVSVPYKIPAWSSAPCHEFYLEVLKDGSIIDKFNVYEKGAYMFGRLDMCDFVLEHPTISRFHAVIQFKRRGDAYLYDLGSTHGTFLNKNQVEKNTYIDLRVGDVIRFGRSTRMFIFQGPSELMPPEANVKLKREMKMREALRDREASLQRAKLEASAAEGISWGMGEDAIVEEEEDDVEEITWQSYKGQLTEKQEKTREKIIKRMEKIGNMKKEINAIRVKDISQGGLTQGQQTQIARNEQRMAQIMEELENLEETLNDSIKESLGARTGKPSHGKKKGAVEDEEDYISDDDDEFYDRTKKKPQKKPGDSQSIETADTLLEKRDTIMKEMSDKKELLMTEKNKVLPETESTTQDDVDDSLDAYMSGLSSQLVYDKSAQLENELATLQSELDRVSYLLKIADPTGEAAKKRELKALEPKPEKAEEVAPTIKKKPPAETQKSSEPCVKADDDKSHVETQKISDAADGSVKEEKPATTTVDLEKSQPGHEGSETENAVFVVPKPQWLGAVEDRVADDKQQLMTSLHPHEMDESDQFVDYKDRNKILGGGDDASTSLESRIESAAPGLILRKRKQVETTGTGSDDASQQSTSSTSGEQTAEDAVALLLKYQRGVYAASDDDGRDESQEKRPKRVLGPEKPSFLSDETDNATWVPPKGQSGDGRTSLNDKYGY